MAELNLLNSKQAAEYLGMRYPTFNRYVNDPDIPLTGTELHPRLKVFTHAELDKFKEYLERHPPRRGRPANPKAPFHGWRDPETRHRRQQPVNIQRVADGIKALVLAKHGNREKEKMALNAINHFETLGWNTHVFAKYCPQFEVQEDGSVIFKGEGSIYQAVIDSLAAYEQAVQG